MPAPIIIVESRHHGNTRLIADAMAAVLHAHVCTPAEAANFDLAQCDLIGLGSGIYFGRMGAELRSFVRNTAFLPRQAFLFSTAGLPFAASLWHWEVRRILRNRGCQTFGEFSCRGWDTVGPLWLIGGLNRHHPNAADLQRAEAFAAQVKSLAID